MKRNLDGVYFRVYRSGKFENVCFSDLSLEERERICENRSQEWFKKMLYIMADTLQEIGDELDIIKE